VQPGEFPDQNFRVCRIRYEAGLFDLLKEFLTFCKDELKISFGFYQIDRWKFFYKHQDYKEEQEVRLLIKRSGSTQEQYLKEGFKMNRYGIIVPFIELECIEYDYGVIRLKVITFGPKSHEADLKIAQLRYMIARKYPEREIHLFQSGITYYR